MTQRGPLAELLMRGIALALALVALLLFSLVIFSVVLAAGVLVFGYLWWKTRSIRAQQARTPDPQRKRPLRLRDLE